jgi:fructose/tagatose bisphosphate aldolase
VLAEDVLVLLDRGVGVEAELGRVEGHEDEAGETLSGATTEPGEAEATSRRGRTPLTSSSWPERKRQSSE